VTRSSPATTTNNCRRISASLTLCEAHGSTSSRTVVEFLSSSRFFNPKRPRLPALAAPPSTSSHRRAALLGDDTGDACQAGHSVAPMVTQGSWALGILSKGYGPARPRSKLIVGGAPS